MMPLNRVCSSSLFLACQNPYAFMRTLARMKAAPLQLPWPEVPTARIAMPGKS